MNIVNLGINERKIETNFIEESLNICDASITSIENFKLSVDKLIKLVNSANQSTSKLLENTEFDYLPQIEESALPLYSLVSKLRQDVENYTTELAQMQTQFNVEQAQLTLDNLETEEQVDEFKTDCDSKNIHVPANEWANAKQRIRDRAHLNVSALDYLVKLENMIDELADMDKAVSDPVTISSPENIDLLLKREKNLKTATQEAIESFPKNLEEIPVPEFDQKAVNRRSSSLYMEFSSISLETPFTKKLQAIQFRRKAIKFQMKRICLEIEELLSNNCDLPASPRLEHEDLTSASCVEIMKSCDCIMEEPESLTVHSAKPGDGVMGFFQLSNAIDSCSSVEEAKKIIISLDNFMNAGLANEDARKGIEEKRAKLEEQKLQSEEHLQAMEDLITKTKLLDSEYSLSKFHDHIVQHSQDPIVEHGKIKILLDHAEKLSSSNIFPDDQKKIKSQCDEIKSISQKFSEFERLRISDVENLENSASKEISEIVKAYNGETNELSYIAEAIKFNETVNLDELDRLIMFWERNKKITRVDITIMEDINQSHEACKQIIKDSSGDLPAKMSHMDEEKYKKASTVSSRVRNQLEVRCKELLRLSEASADWNDLLEACQTPLKDLLDRALAQFKNIEQTHSLVADLSKNDKKFKAIISEMEELEKTTYASVKSLSMSLKNEFPNEIFVTIDHFIKVIETDIDSLRNFTGKIEGMLKEAEKEVLVLKDTFTKLAKDAELKRDELKAIEENYQDVINKITLPSAHEIRESIMKNLEVS